MLSVYLKVAWRNIKKHKLYSLVNVAGLTLGIASCLLIGLYVYNELSYDRFQEKGDRIARVTMDYQISGTVGQTAVTGSKAGPEFKRRFPQVEAYVRTMKLPASMANAAKAFDEKNILYADADFFKIFSFQLLQGNPQTALDAPHKIVLTEKTAQKYFGTQDPMGKTLRLNGGTDYQITGIVKEAPLNSQIQYDIIMSFTSIVPSGEKWSEANYLTYLLLKDKVDIKTVEEQIQAYTKSVKQQEFQFAAGSTDYLTFHLEPMLSVHLHSALPGLEPNGDITYVYVMSIVALLILMIACVNYTNLATAQSGSRGTEIGVRKVLGAGKSQLLRQFLGESLTLSIAALIFAFFLSILILPYFNGITGRDFSITQLLSPLFVTAALIAALLVGLLAGIYPAFVLSSSKLISILKSGMQITKSGGGLRKSLIVFQFVVAVFLIAATIIVLNQVHFIQRKDLGYHREQIIVLPVDYKTSEVYESLKYDIQNNPNIKSVTGSYEGPTSIGWGDGITADDGKGKKELSLNATPVDLDYIKTMGMQLAAGRDFVRNDLLLQDTSNNSSNYKSSYILNENAVKQLGWTPEEAVGKIISKNTPGTVVGVVKDFNFQSLHTSVGPLLIFLEPDMVRELFVKIDAEHSSEAIAALQKIWQSRVSHRPFNYRFLDDDFNALYKTESRTSRLFSIFSMLAITLACMGLFALAAFTAVQRTKEIGIRKILGAGIANITYLLAKQFLVLVIIAIIIATPLIWWAGNNWLEHFAYRININWWVFAFAGAGSMLVALLAVSYNAIRIALINPVKSLRTE